MKGIQDGITIEATNSREIRIGFGFEAYGETICDRIKIIYNLDETADIFIRHDNPCEDADYYRTHLRVPMDAITIKEGLWVKGKMNDNGTKTSWIRGALE